MTRSPWDDVQPIGQRVASVTPAPPSVAPTPEPMTALVAGIANGSVRTDDPALTTDPATMPELIAMLSHLARQLFTEATNESKKSYEREHLGRTLGSIVDKLSSLLDKPARPATEHADDLRPAALDLAEKLYGTGAGRMLDLRARARDAAPEPASASVKA